MEETVERLYSTKEVAGLVGLSCNIIYNWRRQGRGPKPACITPGGHPRYRAKDVLDWFKEFYKYEARA